MTQTIKNIIALLIFAAVAALGYFLFIQKDSTTLMFGQDDPINTRLLVQARSFIEKRMLIESLKIDTTILRDSRFTDLVSYATPVPDQPVGKSSLFEPAQDLKID